MKIIALQAENIKRLVAVEIRPTGELVVVSGKNGQGKTSVLDSIWWALAGLSNVQGMPIRKGEKKAKIRLDIGEMVVTRTFETEDGKEFTSKLIVETADGVRVSSPQAALDKLLGQLSFDPLEFQRRDARGQYDVLKRFVPGVDFDAIEKANKADYDERQALHRQARDHKGAAEKINVELDLTVQPVDESAIIEELAAAGRFNADIETRKGNREKLEMKIADYKKSAESKLSEAAYLEQRASQLRSEAAVDNRNAEAEQQRLKDAAPLPDPVNTEHFKERLEQAKAVNAQVAQIAQKRGHYESADQLNADAEKITARMNARETEKRQKIAAAKLPIKNVQFGDGCILMNGVPFEQASDAEQLAASIKIAMAMNPTLRVIRVRDGSLLDEDSLKMVAGMASAEDYQVWVERVDASGKVGFVIEDGHVKTREE